MTKKLTSLVLALVMCLSLCIPAFAASPAEIYTYYNDGETLVDGYEDENGNLIFRQYVNGILEQKNTIYANNSDIIVREFYLVTPDERTVNLQSDTIRVSDIVRSATSVENMDSLQRASTRIGSINYSAVLDVGYVYDTIICYYTTSNSNTTYTVNKFQGKVIDLVAAFAGAIEIGAVIISAFIDALLLGIGISVVAGVIKSAVTITLNCQKTTYNWTLQDKNVSGHQGTSEGYKYIIKDDEHPKFLGKTYYDGYTPNDWRTQYLAVGFHDTMFSYPAWQVQSWGN